MTSMADVEREWDAREKAGLPKYHSVDQTDIGFRFTSPEADEPGIAAFLAGDFAAMEQAWQGADDVRCCTTFQPIPAQPLDDLPPVETLRETPDGFLAYLACDGHFFARFGAKFLASIDGPAHVHLMDAHPGYADEVIDFLGRPIGLTLEQPRAGPEYYHSVRFCRLAQLLRTRKDPIALLDVDAIANRPVAELPKVPVGMRLRPGRFEPWNQCNASVVIATPEGQAYFDAVADYIFHFWRLDKLRWQIDQSALYCVWKRLGTDIHTLGETDVDYDYRDDGIIWCNSGRNKWFEEDPTRERYRERFNTIQVPSFLEAARSRRPKFARRVAYLSCDYSDRDIESRLLIAKHLIERGIVTLVASDPSVAGNLAHGVPGCYVSASATSDQSDTMQRAIEGGSYVIASDSEALIHANPFDRVSSNVLDLCDRFLANLPGQRDALVTRCGSDKVALTGPAQFELLTRVSFKSVAGPPYILFDTNLPILNSHLGNAETALRQIGGALGLTPETASRRLQAETKAMETLSPLINWLTPQLRVLVRPHPLENAAAWKEAFPDIELVDDVPLTSLIKGARVIVHANSWAGIEAFVVGTPALNISPDTQWGDQLSLKTYNVTVGSAQAAHDVLLPFLRDGLGPLAKIRTSNGDFLKDGARCTADEVSRLLGQATPLDGSFAWSPIKRSAFQRRKFSVSSEYVAQSLNLMSYNGEFREIDDSTFLMWPKQTG